MSILELATRPFPLKTLIYIPTCKDFSRKVMDYRYRLLINTNLANGMKETLPLKHLHLVLNFDEPDLWKDQFEAVSGFDGYLVFQVNRTRHETWQPLRPIDDDLTKVRSLNEFMQDVCMRLHDEDFKPVHVIIVGDGHIEKMSFLNNIMIIDTLKGPEAVRGWKVPLATQEGDRPVNADVINPPSQGEDVIENSGQRISPIIHLDEETK